ncbi:MAG: hypothetical protein ACRESZ_17330, partial [Methylococcales bacterium]
NLNLPRYIDSQEPEDLQDIEAHLRGGIPCAELDALHRYWSVCPGLRQALFKQNRAGYLDLAVEKAAIKPSIYGHPEFTAFIEGMNLHFVEWRRTSAETLRQLTAGCHPKEIIAVLSENLLAHYAAKPLIDGYDVYQHLMDYWAETMQDDCYLIAADGWKAEIYRILEKDNKGREKDKGWNCDLVPKAIIVARYFAAEQEAIDQIAAEIETVIAETGQLEEEHGAEEGAFSDLEKINKANVAARFKELQSEWKPLTRETRKAPSSLPRRRESSGPGNPNVRVRGYDEALDIDPGIPMAAESPASYGEPASSEHDVLQNWLVLNKRETDLKKKLKEAETDLDAKAYARYPRLTMDEIKTLLIDDKWLATLDAAIHGEMNRISQALTRRVKELAERYETPMPAMAGRVAELEAKVNRHLERMGFAWK